MVFEDVVGQSHVTATLRNAIERNRLAHAYLFSGPRGTGKTTMARILAKAINCRQPKGLNPCNECDICEEITNSRSVDVFEIDGASNRGIDEIRNLRDAVRYGPSKSKYKVYIIDEVHMLTKEAFNALLKTLEEPPPYILFIFATTEVQKVPLTILSRCHRFDFRRISIDEIVTRLKYIAQEEKITIDEDSLLLIAKKGDGSLRDAQSIFDQLVSFCGETITATQLMDALSLVDQELFFTTTDLIKERNTKGGLELVENIIQRGYDIREFLSGLLEHLRNLLVVRSTGSTMLIEASETYKKRYQTDAGSFSEYDLLRLMKIVTETEAAVKWSTQPRIRLEAGLLQMIKLDSTVEIQELLKQIEELRQKINGEANIDLGGSTSNSAGGKRSGQQSFSPMNPSTESKSAEALKPVPNAPPRVNEPEMPYVSNPARQQPAGPPPALGAEFPSASVTKTVQPVSLDEIQKKWGEFVAEIRRQRIHVGTLLGESYPLDVRDGAVKLGCNSEYQLTSLKRSKDILTEFAQKVYGKKVRFELSLNSQKPQEPAEKNQPKGGQASDPAALDHPVIRALMRELGAEPLQ